MAADEVEVEVGNRSVRITNPGRVYFPARGETKLDLVRYYLAVGDGIVRASCRRGAGRGVIRRPGQGCRAAPY